MKLLGCAPAELLVKSSSPCRVFRCGRGSGIWQQPLPSPPHPLGHSPPPSFPLLAFPCPSPAQKCLSAAHWNTHHHRLLSVCCPAQRSNVDLCWPHPSQHLSPHGCYNMSYGLFVTAFARAECEPLMLLA